MFVASVCSIPYLLAYPLPHSYTPWSSPKPSWDPSALQSFPGSSSLHWASLLFSMNVTFRITISHSVARSSLISNWDSQSCLSGLFPLILASSVSVVSCCIDCWPTHSSLGLGELELSNQVWLSLTPGAWHCRHLENLICWMMNAIKAGLGRHSN